MKLRIVIFKLVEVEPFLRLKKWNEPKYYVRYDVSIKTKEIDLGEIRP